MKLNSDGLGRIWLVFALVCAYFVGGYVNNTMTNSIADLTVALVDDRSLQVDRYAPYDLDISGHAGHLYSGMPPGLSFLLVPSYLALKLPLAVLPASVLKRTDAAFEADTLRRIPGARPSEKRSRVALLLAFGVLTLAIPLSIAVGMLFARMLELLHPSLTPALLFPVTAFLMLGTPLTDFTATIFHTMVSAAFLWIGFAWLYLRIGRGEGLARGELVAIGASLGLVSTIDYPAMVYALPALLASVLLLPRAGRVRRAAWLGLGFALPLIAMAAYHGWAFGAPWVTSYQARVLPLGGLFQPPPGAGRLGKFLAFLPDGPRIWRVFTDPEINLWIYNPALPLGILASAWLFWQDRRDPRRRLFWAVAFLVQVANFSYFAAIPMTINPAGGSYGARYTVFSLPFSFLALVPALSWLRSRIGGAAFAGLLVVLSIPAWGFLLYGAPRLALAQYARNLMDYGPAGYTLYKAQLMGWLHSPVVPWIGGLVLALTCTWICLNPVNRSSKGLYS